MGENVQFLDKFNFYNEILGNWQDFAWKTSHAKVLAAKKYSGRKAFYYYAESKQNLN